MRIDNAVVITIYKSSMWLLKTFWRLEISSRQVTTITMLVFSSVCSGQTTTSLHCIRSKRRVDLEWIACTCFPTRLMWGTHRRQLDLWNWRLKEQFIILGNTLICFPAGSCMRRSIPVLSLDARYEARTEFLNLRHWGSWRQDAEGVKETGACWKGKGKLFVVWPADQNGQQLQQQQWLWCSPWRQLRYFKPGEELLQFASMIVHIVLGVRTESDVNTQTWCECV